MRFVSPLPVWRRQRNETAETSGVEGKSGFVFSYHLFSWHVTAACPFVLQGLSTISIVALCRFGNHLHGLDTGVRNRVSK